MKILVIKPENVANSYLLFDTMEEVFRENGHSFVQSIEEADVIFFDIHAGIFNFDFTQIGKVISSKKPVVVFDALDYWTGDGKEGENVFHWDKLDINKPFQLAIDLFLKHDLLKVYFMRKPSSAITYDKRVYPLETILYPDHVFPEVSAEELNSRPYDITFIGNKATPRNNVCKALEECGLFKTKFILGQEKLFHEDWLNEHRQSKLFLEAGGGGESQGGFGSERLFQLITISPCLRIRTEQVQYRPFVDGKHLIEIGGENGLGVPSEEDLTKLHSILKNPTQLHQIYLSGIKHTKEYYSVNARANHVLGILKKEGIE